jgi:enoyl-CoA hydratase/carnithine racemase
LSENSQNQDPVRCERRDSSALVTIDRRSVDNALNLRAVQELTNIFSELKDDSGVRAVILTGAGDRAFSAGADVEEIAALTPQEATSYASAGQVLTRLIERLGKPIIGAINGPAYGCGCELALACTWRIATKKAEFAQPEATLGLTPAWGGIGRLSRLIGRSGALEMILTGEPIPAEEALRIGLVNRIAEDSEEMMAVCEELAQQIARSAPLAVKYALEAVNHAVEMPLEEGLRLESALFGLCFATEDVREGTRAFLEKRHPIFEGR